MTAEELFLTSIPTEGLVAIVDDDDVVAQAASIVRGLVPSDDDEERLTAEEVATIDAVIDATDAGNANRYVHWHGEDHKYLSDTREWIGWNGIRWEPDIGGDSIELAKDVTERMLAEASELLGQEFVSKMDEYEGKALRKHAYTSRSRGRLGGMVELAQSDPAIRMQSDQLDTNPWRLGCANGIVDLSTGRLIEPERADFITMSTGIEFDPNAQCPVWDAFVDWAMCGSNEMVDFVQRLIGYTICGDVSERIMVSMFGSTGSNGKSTLLNTLDMVMGDYGLSVEASTFEKATISRGGGAASAHITQLKGKRFVGASEIDQGFQVATALLKVITGNDNIAARDLYAKRATVFRGTSTIWIASNHKLELPAEDQAMWDRLKFVPFDARVEDADKDRHLNEKLASEAPGILAWMVRGCLEWQKRGLASPESVKAATASYRSEMDYFRLFLDHIEEDGWLDMSRAGLHSHYLDFAQRNGLRKLNQREFPTEMKRAGFVVGGHDKHWEKVL